MSKSEYGIYTGTRISKDDLKGEFLSKISFYLDDVHNWEEYPEGDTYANQEEKIYVDLPRGCYIIIETFDRFDAIMKRHNSCKVPANRN
jgi:hypothetical protein